MRWHSPPRRVADGKGGNSTAAIGTADDFQDADGSRVLDFWQAQDRARALAQADRPTLTWPVRAF